MERVLELRELYPSYSKANALVRYAPSNLTEDMDLVPKAEVIERYQSRFSK